MTMTHRSSQIASLLLGTALITTACGGPEEPADEPRAQGQPDSASATEYGSVEEVSEYLDAIDPFIREIGDIQARVDKVLGSTGQGTGANLAPAAGDARQRLAGILEDITAVAPPPLLAPFHRDIKGLIALRLEAYASTVTGWEIEQGGGDFRTHYDDAQSRYKKANEAIVALNGQMEKINKAVQLAGAGG